ncbi:MAG: MFS transporter [Burkholderiaceae bacterium]
MTTPSTPVTFAALVLLLVLSGLDQTILSTTLPSIAASLGGRDLAPWVFSAYLMASTAAIPLYGKLADRFGTRPLLLASTALFALGSLACAEADSMRSLVAARALQGLGGGGLMTLTMLAIASLYPLPERGRRMGALGAAFGLSTLAGPLVGALLLEALPWTWAFLLNIPGALLALAVLARADLGAARAHALPLDWRGAALLSGGLLVLLLAVRSATDEAGGSFLPQALIAALPTGVSPSLPLLLSAGMMLTAWVIVERRAADPVVHLALFARRPFAVVSLLSALSGVMMFAAVVFVPLFLQQGLGLSPMRSALATLPLMLGITIAGQAAGRMLRGGTALSRVAAFAALGLKLGFALLVAALHWLPAHGALPASLGVAVALAPIGLGLGMLFPLISVVAQRSAPPRQLGVATAMPVMLRALGGAFGVALFGELLRHHMASAAAAGLHSQHEAMLAFAGGTARIAGFAAAAAMLALVASRGLAGVGKAAPDATPSTRSIEPERI